MTVQATETAEEKETEHTRIIQRVHMFYCSLAQAMIIAPSLHGYLLLMMMMMMVMKMMMMGTSHFLLLSMKTVIGGTLARQSRRTSIDTLHCVSFDNCYLPTVRFFFKKKMLSFSFFCRQKLCELITDFVIFSQVPHITHAQVKLSQRHHRLLFYKHVLANSNHPGDRLLLLAQSNLCIEVGTKFYGS